MSEMIERVARAIYESQPDKLLIPEGRNGVCAAHPVPWNVVDDYSKAQAFGAAHAAIEAMRELTGAMKSAGVETLFRWQIGTDGDITGTENIYHSMIDAALPQNKKPASD